MPPLTTIYNRINYIKRKVKFEGNKYSPDAAAIGLWCDRVRLFCRLFRRSPFHGTKRSKGLVNECPRDSL